MVNFTGRCLVHRAEILQLRGAWPAALDEARRAERRFGQAMHEVAAGEAAYRQGEIHRLRGERAAAARRTAMPDDAAGIRSRGCASCGWPRGTPTPLQPRSAAPWVRRLARSERAAPPSRLHRDHAGGRATVDDARAACRELEEITDGFRSGHARRGAAQATGRHRPCRRRRLGGARAAASGVSRVAASSMSRSKPRGSACWSGWPAARSATTDTGDAGTGGAPGGVRAAGSRAGRRPRRLARPERRRAQLPMDSRARELEVLRLVAAGETNKDDRRVALPQRADGRAPRQQHPRQAPRAVARGRHRLRVRAPAALSRRGWKHPGHLLPKVGWFLRCAASCRRPSLVASCSAVTIDRNDTMTTHELEQTRQHGTVSPRATTSSSRRRTCRSANEALAPGRHRGRYAVPGRRRRQPAASASRPRGSARA